MFPTEPVPEKIGAYKVIRRLGGAGSADLYLGKMEGPMGFERVCALKLVANSIEGDVRLAEELAREASIIARLNHPAIVRMFDFFEYERRLVLVLEHVDGVDLDRLIQHLARRKQPLRDEAIWYVAHQLCGALAHAHGAKDEEGSETPVVHRNIQPENVLISWEGQVRLTGFGLGKVLGRSPDTVVGVVKGTPGYMAPEQARGERVTTRADVYGLGVLIWSLLTGKRPPVDGSRPESVTHLRSDIPREIAAAIDATLEPSADRRKITCQEMDQWLTKVAKVEAGRNELRDKVLRLRSARTAAVEPASLEARSTRTSGAPRRRVSLRGVRPSQRPPGPGPLSAPSRSSRPPVRITGSPSSGPIFDVPRSALRPARPPSIPDASTIDALLESTLNPPRSAAPPGAAATGAAITALVDGMGGTSSGRTQPPPLPGGTQPPLLGQAPGELAPSPVAWRDPLSGAAIAGPNGMPSPPLAPAPERVGIAAAAGRPLSALASIGIAAGTAAIVVTLGVFIAERELEPRRSAVDPGSAFSSAVAAGTRSPSTPGTPAGETKRGGVAPPNRGADPGQGASDPSLLPGGIGLLTVVFPARADVYLNGKSVGPVNEAIQVRCGRWFVRMGTPTQFGIPQWGSKGETVIIPCQGAVTINVQPAPSGPP